MAKKVIFVGTTLAAIAYIIAGIFGYVAFAGNSTTEELDVIFADNILSAPYRTASG
jgi:amino acid permease